MNAAARTDRWLPEQGGRVTLEGQSWRFGLRTAREGRLHLTGLILDSTGHPLAKGALHVATQSGFEQSLALNGQPISLAIPSREGSHLVQIDLSDSQNAPDPVWEQFGWRWEPGAIK